MKAILAKLAGLLNRRLGRAIATVSTPALSRSQLDLEVYFYQGSRKFNLSSGKVFSPCYLTRTNGSPIRVRLYSGKIVEAEITAITNQSAGRNLQIVYGSVTASINPEQIEVLP